VLAACADQHSRTQHHVYELPGPGQSSYQLSGSAPVSSLRQEPVPIASLAKVMTAYLVLLQSPLGADGGRLSVTVSHADVRDTAVRARRGESIVPVARGEALTEREALAAVLLPSANNIAVMLARRAAGSVTAFVQRMNRMAQTLGMRHTVYTDPSGLDADTRSTAADQLVLANYAMRNPDFAALVALSSYKLPVVGIVQSTDELLGFHGFVGIKTGSDDAAGGCFMFRTHHASGDLTGVVLGRRGPDLIAAALVAAVKLDDAARR
jgi:D-alanyl-D-alanine carboxypeptidase (penicillin-binding protein 5/6)